MRVCINPTVKGDDLGEGGVGRVIREQMRGLPALGVEVVARPEDADVLACHITIPPAWLRRFGDKPIVAHCHGLYWTGYEWSEWALKANTEVTQAILAADVVTVPTEWVAHAVRRNYARRPLVVPHGVHLDEWATDEPSLGYVLWDKNRPDPICNPYVVDRLAAMLPGRAFVTTFGEERANVQVVGRRTYVEAREMVKRAGAYLATTKETFGIGTLQAMAAGVPVVGYAHGGTAELLAGHPVLGEFVVEPYDVESLARATERALTARNDLIPYLRAEAAKWTWEEPLVDYARAYAGALLERRATGFPAVTVVVTAYKLDRYLDDCLASVARQSGVDWECLVVDDASPDDCGRIADEWARRDSRFHAIHNETNRYLAGARNVGIAQARGRYVLPLDADDMLPDGALAVLADALDDDRECDIAYGNVYFVDEDGVTPRDYGGDSPGHSGWPFEFAWQWQIRGRNLLPYSSMFRRSVWDGVGGYRERVRTAEDAEFWTIASSYGFRPKRVTSRDTLTYRVRAGSMSHAETQRDWTAWLPWRTDTDNAPAGAFAWERHVPVRSYEPVVSVVIPVGPGHARHVQAAVDSVMAQTFPDWEVIVADNSGESLPPLPAWARVVTLEPGVGPATARNAALALARGRLFLPLDADDLLEPDCLEVMFRASRERPDDVIYSDFWQNYPDASAWNVYRTEDYDARNLLGRGIPWGVTSLAPIRYWRDVGGYDATLPAWEDWAFALALAERGVCFTRVPRALWSYRKDTGTRREDNVANFEASKAGILARFGHLWNGDTLMACSSCRGTRTSFDPGAASSSPAAAAGITGQAMANEGDAVLIGYTGAKAGGVVYRGPSGHSYTFAAGDIRYVLRRDADAFLARKDFRRVERAEVMGEGATPLLAADVRS